MTFLVYTSLENVIYFEMEVVRRNEPEKPGKKRSKKNQSKHTDNKIRKNLKKPGQENTQKEKRNKKICGSFETDLYLSTEPCTRTALLGRSS